MFHDNCHYDLSVAVATVVVVIVIFIIMMAIYDSHTHTPVYLIYKVQFDHSIEWLIFLFHLSDSNIPFSVRLSF